MSSPELRPCPFCGHARAATRYTEQESNFVRPYAAQVECAKCGASGPEIRGTHRRTCLTKAERKWNTRRPAPDLPAAQRGD